MDDPIAALSRRPTGWNAMIALRGVWQLFPPAFETVLPRSRGLSRGERLFALGCCFLAAAVSKTQQRLVMSG
jgi:hypothetical protein